MDLWKDLASIAAAAGPDGGLAVAKTLRALLVDQVPSDRAEIAIEGPQGFDRKSLTEDPTPLVEHDLLTAIASARTPLRVDDLFELEVYPKTAERMRTLGMRSLLALPLSAAGGAKGVVVLLRDYPFAFAGVPLYRIEPMMAMAGIAMTQALALTAARAAAALGADREALEGETTELLSRVTALAGRLERAEMDRDRLESEAGALRAEAERLRAELSAASVSLATAQAAGRSRRRRKKKGEQLQPSPAPPASPPPPPDGEPSS